MEAYAKALMYAIPGFVALIVIESLAAYLMGKKINRGMDVISSLSSGMTNTLKSLLGLAVIIVSYAWMERHIGIFDIQSATWLYILAFIGHDFAGYWAHRFNHKINLFWNRHVVHHSSEEFNLSCALRQEISAIVGIYFFLYIPMALIGIPATIVAIVAPIHLFAQFWYHTRLIGRMGFLEYILVTPSHHRVHHAINDVYIDKNLSQIFIIWDKLFGTFQEELAEEEPIYGTLKQANTWNPFLINFMHVWQITKDAWRTQKLWDKLRVWFMPTGWRPADVAEKYPIEKVGVYDRKKYNPETSRLLKGWSWFQLIVVNALMYHMLVNFPNLSAQEILWYSIFLFISIFSYTTLMDKHILAVPVEFIKTILGFAIIYYFGGWFGLDNFIGLGTTIIVGYLILSIAMTLYFTFAEKRSETEVNAFDLLLK